MSDNTTVIVNNMEQELDMKVGNYHYFVDFVSLPKGGMHKLHVDYNDTYQEFVMGKDKSSNKLIVRSESRPAQVKFAS